MYVSSVTNEPELIVSLKTTLDVEPDAEVAVVLKIVDVAVVGKLYQHDAEPLVSAEPVLHVEPLSKKLLC